MRNGGFVVAMTPLQFAIGWLLTLPIRIVIFAFQKPLRFFATWVLASMLLAVARVFLLHSH